MLHGLFPFPSVLTIISMLENATKSKWESKCSFLPTIITFGYPFVRAVFIRIRFPLNALGYSVAHRYEITWCICEPNIDSELSEIRITSISYCHDVNIFVFRDVFGFAPLRNLTNFPIFCIYGKKIHNEIIFLGILFQWL